MDIDGDTLSIPGRWCFTPGRLPRPDYRSFKCHIWGESVTDSPSDGQTDLRSLATPKWYDGSCDIAPNGQLALGGNGVMQFIAHPVFADCNGCIDVPGIYILKTGGDYVANSCEFCDSLNNRTFALLYVGGCTWASNFDPEICPAAGPIQIVLEVFEGLWTLSFYSGVVADCNFLQIAPADWNCGGPNTFTSPRWQFNTCSSLSSVTVTPYPGPVYSLASNGQATMASDSVIAFAAAPPDIPGEGNLTLTSLSVISGIPVVSGTGGLTLTSLSTMAIVYDLPGTGALTLTSLSTMAIVYDLPGTGGLALSSTSLMTLVYYEPGLGNLTLSSGSVITFV